MILRTSILYYEKTVVNGCNQGVKQPDELYELLAFASLSVRRLSVRMSVSVRPYYYVN
jgi:hypothetical protein